MRKYTFKNHLGTPVTGTDSSGNILWRERYTPFGDEAPNNAVNDNEPGYTGHVFDADTDLTYMQARYYDPVIGRFLSIDPVGFTPEQPSTFNRYSYTSNDPVNSIDPDGREEYHIAGSGRWVEAMGIKGGFDLVFDTSNIELSLDLYAGVRAGGSYGVSGTYGVRPSTVDSNEVRASFKGSAEASAIVITKRIDLGVEMNTSESSLQYDFPDDGIETELTSRGSQGEVTFGATIGLDMGSEHHIGFTISAAPIKQNIFDKINEAFSKKAIPDVQNEN